MNPLEKLDGGLAWLGRQGTVAVAAIVALAIAVPPVGTLLRPYFAEAVMALLVLAFLRVEPEALQAQFKRFGIVLAAALWTMIALPALLIGAYRGIGLEAQAPALFLALTLQAVASPLMSSPAIAALMGLDAALVLSSLLAATALVPITAPAFVRLALGDTLSIAPVTLGLRLFAIIASAAVIASILRRVFGSDAIARRKDEIDGLNIIVLYIFVAALMGDLVERTMAQPLLVVGLTALSFALAFALLGLTMLVFCRSGSGRAFALGLMVSQRNMALVLAAAGGALPDLVWLYIAVSQFPIYLMPHLLKPIVERINNPR